MGLVEVVSFATAFGDTIRIEVVRSPPNALTHEQAVRARVAARELRLGVEQNFEPVVVAVQRLHQTLRGIEPDSVPRAPDPSLGAFFESLVDALERDLELGRLLVVEGAFPLLEIPPEPQLVLRERLELEEPPLPSIARPPPPDKLTFFEVRFVDEIGQAIGGLEVEFSAAGRVETAKTNPVGIGTLEDVVGFSATVDVVDTDALGKLLDPRWEKARRGAAPTGVNTQRFAFDGQDIAGVSLKPVVPNTVVITPPLGKLFVELLDKFGYARHIEQSYSITGPESFSGKTDEDGRLLHDEVLHGDYELTLSLEIDAGDGEVLTEDYKSPLVVLRQSTEAPQVRMLGVVPRVVMARMRGMLFDTNKCFLLPTALEALEQIRKLYFKFNPSELLLVGHTDTTAQPDINDPLSQERADSMKAYLEDDVDTWLANYDLSGKKCWGSREDRLMITAMAGFSARGEDEDLVEWYQRTRELTVDGIAGPETRRALVTEYMSLDGVKISEEPRLFVNIQTHGAGENFPLADTGFELDTQAANEKNDPFDRRVEFFFFDNEFGPLPEPGAPDGEEYLEWRKRASENHDFPIEGIGKRATVIEFEDVLFRTNSAVVLPEGETPSTDEHEAVTSVGLFASALRFAEEHPKKKLFIAGHTDTTATVEFNQTLSQERAECALAVLEGKRSDFVTLVTKRHQVADVKQILSWCAKAFKNLGFDCDPGTIDNNAATGAAAVENFQVSYNANASTLGVAGGIKEDGIVGDETWGAFFDMYEFGIRDELGEKASAVASMRSKLVFVDDARKALGFSEHHPVDQIGRDQVRSQSNRRVEVLFFDPGEEPDLVLAESDPDISEIYLPAEYVHITLPPAVTTKRKGVALQLETMDGLRVPGIDFIAVMDDGSERTGTLDANGSATINAAPGAKFKVEYLDQDKIRAHALAARLAQALDNVDHELVLGVVGRPRRMFDLIQAAVDQFFPRGDLIEEIRNVTRGTTSENSTNYFLAGLGFGEEGEGELVVFNEPTEGGSAVV